MEQNNVHDRVNRDKAWNDPSNKFLQGLEIMAFQSPRVKNAELDTTHFVAVVGKGTMFDPTVSGGVKLTEAVDGESSTIMLIEHRESKIPWYKPEDVTIDEAVAIIKDPKNRLGTIVAFADVSIEVIPNTIDEAKLRAMFTRNGGEIIEDY